MVQTKIHKKVLTLLPDGIHNVSLDSIGESLNEDLNPVCSIRFKNEAGFNYLKLPINASLPKTLSNIAAIGGYKVGSDLKLHILIDLKFKITINNNKVIKISKP